MAIEDLLESILKEQQRTNSILSKFGKPAAKEEEEDQEEEPEAKPAKRAKVAAPAESAKAKRTKAAAATPEHDVDDIRILALAVRKNVEEGDPKIIALLQRFGAKGLKELKATQYDEFYSQLTDIKDKDFDPRDSDVSEEEDEEEPDFM